MGKQAAAIGANLQKSIAQVAIDFVLTLDKKLRQATPVDTGHARRNWISSVTQPHAAEVDNDAAHAAGIAEVLRYTLQLGPLWLANNAPYVRRLNYGWSKQAPAGFIERCIDEALQEVQQRWGARGVDVSNLRASFQSAAGGAAAANLAAAYSPFGGDG